MRVDVHHRRWFILVTFLIALGLDILPLPGWVIWLRPSWTLLVLLYWAMALPNVVGIFYALMIGLLLDLLNGTVLGEHAVALIVVTYIMIKFHQLIRVYPLMQQTIIIFLLFITYQIIIFAIQGFVGQLPHTILYWLSGVISTLLWPWVFVLLRDWRRKLNVI